MKDEKKLIKIAEQILTWEKECQLGYNIKENMNKIERLIHTLSIEEMLIIDTYITNQNFLTK